MRVLLICSTLMVSGIALAAESAPAASESAPAAKPVMVRVDAGQALYPLTRAITESFQKSPAAAKSVINVGRQGGGLRRLCDKHADVAEVSRAVTEADLAACKQNGVSVLALPVAMDALVITVNPHNAASRITLDALRAMWADASQGKIRRWEQADASLPAQPLKLYGPENNTPAAESFSVALFGKAGQLRSDVSVSADDGILVQALERDLSGIGYVGYPYYFERRTRVKALAVETASGKAVLPTPETLRDGSYKPFTRSLQLYVSTQALQRPEVMAYIDYYLRNASHTAQALKYVALSDAEYTKNLDGLRKAAAQP